MSHADRPYPASIHAVGTESRHRLAQHADREIDSRVIPFLCWPKTLPTPCVVFPLITSPRPPYQPDEATTCCVGGLHALQPANHIPDGTPRNPDSGNRGEHLQISSNRQVLEIETPKEPCEYDLSFILIRRAKYVLT